MSAAAHTAGPAGEGWAVRDGDPFLAGGSLPGGAAPGDVSRFGDDHWDLTPLNTYRHQTAVRLNWELIPPPIRPSFRRAGWALVNLPTPDELLERPRANQVKWISPVTVLTVFTGWHTFSAWLAERDTTRLCEVSADDLDDYAAHVATLGLSRRKAADRLRAVSLLWGFAPHLPACDRIPMPPWDAGSTKDYLPGTEARNENSTPPIHPAVMSPLLVWALRFVEDFTGDITAAWDERRRLTGRIREHANPEATRPLRRLAEAHAAEDRPLPGSVYHGRRSAALSYLAGLTGASIGQVRWALRNHARGMPVGTETPLDTPVHGRLGGQPWKPHINFNEAPVLVHALATACMIVIFYLSGVRPGEGLGLEVGCCPDPGDDGTGSLRHEIHGNVHKGARDADGRLVPGGLPRRDPWIVIPPVAHAVRVLERLAEGPLLFPVKTAWANPTPGNRRRPGEALSTAGANERITAFIAWVNDFADRNGLPGERIPADPAGPVVVNRFRRTVAWHIARLPGGRIALATQYGHLRASAVAEGYAGRARDGLRRVLDIETARAMADYLDTVAERIRHGEGVSGPAARRMAAAARDAAHRFEGMFLTPKHASALLAEPRFHVYDNPGAFLTCNHDPAKALCHPERTRPAQRTLPPAIDRCDPACANIARTDPHIAELREEITRLADEAGDPLTPAPLRERLRQRTTTLQAIVDRHEKTRVVLAREDHCQEEHGGPDT